MPVKPVQSENTPLPIAVTELGMFTFVNPVQPQNVASPIVIREVPNVTCSNPVQQLKTPSEDQKDDSSALISPKDNTEFGMLMLVKPVHELKAPFPITVTELGKLMLVRPVHLWNA